MANETSIAEVRSGTLQCSVRVTIDGEPVDPANIETLIVREWMYDDVKTPRLELIISDDGVFTDVNIPYRGKIISVKISRDKSDEEDIFIGSYIDTEFVILDFNFVKELGSSPGNNSKIIITGIINIPNWFKLAKDMSFSKRTSSQVLSSVCSDVKLNFYNNSSVDDSMNWIRINQTPGQFIQHVVSRAKASKENDLVLFWIDIYKNANYTTLNNLLSDSIAHPAKYNLEYYQEVGIKDLLYKAKIDGIEDKEARNTIWYSSLEFRNNEGTNVVIKGGTTYEDKLNFNDGTYYLGKGSSSSNESPLKLNAVKNFNQYDNFLSGSINPGEIFPGVDNSLYSGSILTGQLDNFWGEDYISNPFRRSAALSALYNNSVTIEMNPNTPTMLGEKVNLEVHSNIANKDGNYKNAALSGEYLITGSIYALIDGFFKKFLFCNRLGFNSQDIE